MGLEHATERQTYAGIVPALGCYGEMRTLLHIPQKSSFRAREILNTARSALNRVAGIAENATRILVMTPIEILLLERGRES